MDVALTILALVAGGLAFGLFTSARPPLGFQDENRLLFGTPATDRPDRSVLSTLKRKQPQSPQAASPERRLEPATAT